MKKILILILLTAFFYFEGSSQFLVYPPEKTRSDIFHTLLPQTNTNQFQFLVLRDNNFTTPFRERHQILTYDFNGQFIDSVNLPKGFVPISFPLKLNNFFYWSSLYIDTTQTIPNTQDAFVLKFDTLFNCVAKKRISNLVNTSEYPSNIIEINHKLFISIRNNITDDFKLYKIDTLLNKIDSTFQNGLHFISELQKTHDNKILIAGTGFPAPPTPSGTQKVMLDTTLQTTTVFNLDSLTYVTAGGSILTGCSSQIGIDPLFFKIVPISSTKNYIVGYADVVYNSNCNSRKNIVHSIIDNNNKILNTTLIADSLRDVRYADNTNFFDFKNDCIFTVCSEGYYGWLLANSNSSILVTKSDTMGNLIWKKRYGDDMYYRPVSIIQTLDSGFLVSGIRYDYQNTIYQNVAQSFILRLNKNGNLVSTGIKEQGSNNFISFKCFPNPAKDAVYFDVFLTSSYQLEIFDILGKSVYQDKNYQNKSAVSIEFLNSGQYIYKLKTKENYFTGKIIKE